MKQITLSVCNREGTGRGPARRLRAKGEIPAIVYGKSGTRPLSIVDAEFRKLMRAVGGSVAIIEIQDDKGGKALSLIKEVQRDPITDRFEHVDFQEVSATEELHTEIPVHIVGESIGVKVENGLLQTQLHVIRVRCLPKDLPEYVEVDVTDLHAGDAFHVRQLAKIPGVTFLGDQETVIVACTSIKEEEEEAPAAEGAAPAEGAAAAPAAEGAKAAEPAKK